MAFTISRVDRVYRDYDVIATLRNGTPATLTGVDVALLPPRSKPVASTVWTAMTYENGVATVLLAGPDADPDGALPVPEGGADVWVRVVDNPEIDAAHVERINVDR